MISVGTPSSCLLFLSMYKPLSLLFLHNALALLVYKRTIPWTPKTACTKLPPLCLTHRSFCPCISAAGCNSVADARGQARFPIPLIVIA